MEISTLEETIFSLLYHFLLDADSLWMDLALMNHIGTNLFQL